MNKVSFVVIEHRQRVEKKKKKIRNQRKSLVWKYRIAPVHVEPRTRTVIEFYKCTVCSLSRLSARIMQMRFDEEEENNAPAETPGDRKICAYGSPFRDTAS